MDIDRKDLGDDLAGEVAWIILSLSFTKCQKDEVVPLLRYAANCAIEAVRANTSPGVGTLKAARFRLMCVVDDGEPIFDLLFPLQGGELTISLGYPEAKAMSTALGKAIEMMHKQPGVNPEFLALDNVKLMATAIGDGQIPQSVSNVPVE